MRVPSVRWNPPGEGKSFVTYTARIGYALPDEGRNRTRLDAGQPSTNVVPVEVSINEPIGTDADVAVGDRSLRVSTPDGIVAEKLRAFCSRKGRSATGTGPKTSRTWLDKISRFLLEKAQARDVPVSKTAFRDPELAKWSRYGYDDLRVTVREDFVPFEEALQHLLGNLDIPEH